LPRDLADVLHYFMPELARPDEETSAPPEPNVHPPKAEAPADDLLPLATVPVADSDLVRAGLVASLADEVTGLGGRSIILTPDTPNARAMFAGGGGNSETTRIEVLDAHSIHELAAAAVDRASALKEDEAIDGVVIARVPPAWLEGDEVPGELFDWLLLFTSTHERNLVDAYSLAARVLRENPEAEIGVTVHGAAARREGEAAFGLLARSVEQHLGRSVANYGLLLEDLDIYRSLAAGQAIGRAHPDSPANVSLREAAKLVFERARKTAFH
jgi:hypothetical protein